MREYYKYFIKDYEFDQEEAKERAAEMGKDLIRNFGNNELKKKKGFIDTMRLNGKRKSLTKEDIQKMAEDYSLKV